jgi:hypothetical protein
LRWRAGASRVAQEPATSAAAFQRGKVRIGQFIEQLRGLGLVGGAARQAAAYLWPPFTQAVQHMVA